MTNDTHNAIVDKIRVAIEPMFGDLDHKQQSKIAKQLLKEKGLSKVLKKGKLGDPQELLEKIYQVR